MAMRGVGGEKGKEAKEEAAGYILKMRTPHDDGENHYMYIYFTYSNHGS